jgi:hypothetical protein
VRFDLVVRVVGQTGPADVAFDLVLVLELVVQLQVAEIVRQRLALLLVAGTRILRATALDGDEEHDLPS